MRETHTRGEDRGQMAVLAVVLLIGIVAVGSIGILLVGSAANKQGKKSVDKREVRISFLKLSQDIDTVSRRPTGERNVDLDLPDSTDFAVQVNNVGHIWVNRTNYSTGSNETLVNQKIGAIQFSHDDGTVLAYQSSAVFRGLGNRTTILSPPDFVYRFNPEGRFPTLNMPVVVTNGHYRLNAGQTLKIKNVRTIAPLNDVSIVENDLVTVRIKSDYYVGWAKHFRQLANSAKIPNRSAVSVDHANNTTTLKLIVPATRKKVIGGVVTGAAGQDLVVGQSVTVDSYNSSVASYSATPSANRKNGKMVVAGNLIIENKGTVYGDTIVRQNVTFENQAKVKNGNLSYGGTVDYHMSKSVHVPDGWAAANASVKEYQAVDTLIDVIRSQNKDDNNNSATSTITGNLLSCGGSCTLHSGSYYFEELTLNGDLTLNTTQGPITIAVNGSMTLNNNALLDVVGDDRVNIYIDHAAPGVEELDLNNNAEISTPQDNASRLWIYMDKDANVTMKKSKMDGVVFGPGDTDGGPGTDIRIKTGAQVYGAVVGDVDEMSQFSGVHFDRSLLSVESIQRATVVPKLTFLHVSVYEVCVVEKNDEGKCSARPIPAADPKPEAVDPGETFTLDASNSSDDGSIVKYEWDTDGDGAYEKTTTSQDSITMSFPSKGIYKPHVRVTDDDNYTRQISPAVRVDMPPYDLSISSSPSPPDEGETVNFDGEADDEDADSTLTYKWDFQDDGTYDATGAGLENPSWIYSSPGLYDVRMAVTDTDGNTEIYRTQIRVNAIPHAHYDYKPSSPEVGDTMTFNASDSFDPDGNVATYKWDFDGDGSYDTTTTVEKITHSYGTAGPKTVTLKVTDDDGGTNTTTKSFTVSTSSNSNPSASFTYSPSSPSPGDSVSFDASGSSDSDGSIVKYEWDWTSDGTYDATGQTASHTYSSSGSYTVTLRVTDDAGATDTTTKTVSVGTSNSAPSASFTYSPSSPSAGESVSFDASGSSDSDGSISSYEWDWTSDGTYDATGKTASHTYSSGGSYTVTLRVTDDDGATDTTTKTVTVNSPPSASFTYNPSNPSTADSVSFDASGSSDSDGSISSYEWDWTSDGTYDATGKTASHTYSSSGSYTVTLRVTDDDGATSTTTKTVSVSSAGSPPTINSFSVEDKSRTKGGNTEAWYRMSWDVSDPDGDLSSVTVTVTNVDDGTTSTYTGPSGSNVDHKDSNDDGDTYEIKLEATDSNGNTVCEKFTGTADGKPDEAKSSC